MSRRAPMQIVYWEVGVNLRTDAGWSRAQVEKIAREHQLQDGQCVVLFNNSKYLGGSGSHPPKCRIYWMQAGRVMTLIPPTDSASQVDLQHQLNDWLRAVFGASVARTEMDGVLDEFDGHYCDRKQRMAAAAQAEQRRKKGG